MRLRIPDGGLRMTDGRWQMANGRWQMANGKWPLSALFPLRGPFLQEGRDAFLGIGAKGILDHDIGCLRIGRRFVQPLEFVECPLSHPEHAGAQGEDGVDERLDRRVEFMTGNHAVDQSELKGSVRGDGRGGHEHFQGGAGRYHADQGDHGRRAEEADLDPRGGEGGLLRGHGQVAGCDQLAARRCCQAVHPRDHGLVEPAEAEHHPAAQLEELSVVVLRTAHKLREIITRREDRTFAAEHDNSCRPVRADRAEAVLQPQQQLTGESVAPLGTVEREPDDALVRFVNQAVWGRAKGTFLIVAARCPVCGEPVCLDRSTYQNNYECPLRLPTNEITRTTSPDSLVYKPNNLTSHQASIGLILVSASPALMATFTASSIGSLKGTSIRSRPCS